MSSREVHSSPSVDKFSANPSAMEFWNLPPKTRGSTSTPMSSLCGQFMTGKRGGHPSPWCLCLKQFVGSSGQIVFGATEKTTRRFCDSSPPWKWKNPDRNITSPSGFKEIRRREKNEKTFLFVAIKCLRK